LSKRHPFKWTDVSRVIKGVDHDCLQFSRLLDCHDTLVETIRLYREVCGLPELPNDDVVDEVQDLVEDLLQELLERFGIAVIIQLIINVLLNMGATREGKLLAANKKIDIAEAVQKLQQSVKTITQNQLGITESLAGAFLQLQKLLTKTNFIQDLTQRIWAWLAPGIRVLKEAQEEEEEE